MRSKANLHKNNNKKAMNRLINTTLTVLTKALNTYGSNRFIKQQWRSIPEGHSLPENVRMPVVQDYDLIVIDI